VYNGSQLMDFLTGKGAYVHESDKLPDLLIMDVHLNLITSFDILDYLQKNQKYSCLPVFILTKTVKEEEKVKAMDLGVRDYFQKPLDKEQWNKMVGDICKEVFSHAPAKK
jgi:DNA-binding response OmpR family regulator